MFFNSNYIEEEGNREGNRKTCIFRRGDPFIRRLGNFLWTQTYREFKRQTPFTKIYNSINLWHYPVVQNQLIRRVYIIQVKTLILSYYFVHHFIQILFFTKSQCFDKLIQLIYIVNCLNTVVRGGPNTRIYLWITRILLMDHQDDADHSFFIFLYLKTLQNRKNIKK